MNLEIKDKVGHKYIHREFRFTVPELAETFQQGFVDDRYLAYYTGEGNAARWWREQIEKSGEVEFQLKLCFNTKTGGFTIRLGKKPDNLEKLVALGRRNK